LFKINRSIGECFQNTLPSKHCGSMLLGTIYLGFSYIASFHGDHIVTNTKDELLAAITMKIAGPYAGVLVCIAIVQSV